MTVSQSNFSTILIMLQRLEVWRIGYLKIRNMWWKRMIEERFRENKSSSRLMYIQSSYIPQKWEDIRSIFHMKELVEILHVTFKMDMEE